MDGYQFLHGVTLDEGSGVLRVVRDDLVNCVQNGHHRIPLQVLRRVLLPARQIADEVPQSIAPCNDGERQKSLSESALEQSHVCAGEI